MDGLDFSGLTVAELATLRTNVLAAINAVLTGSQSYSMHGRSFTRANLPELNSMLRAISSAQAVQSGTGARNVYADMSNG